MLRDCLVNFVGEETGTWYLDLKNGKGATGKGEPSQPPDATLTMDSQNLFAMFSGKYRHRRETSNTSS